MPQFYDATPFPDATLLKRPQKKNDTRLGHGRPSATSSLVARVLAANLCPIVSNKVGFKTFASVGGDGFLLVALVMQK